MTTNTDDAITVFGEALRRIDFWGRSATNPNDMKNNCVSVSVARLEHYPTVEDFWQDIYGHPLPDRPLNEQEILDLLRRTGWTYTMQDFQTSATASAYQQFNVNTATLRKEMPYYDDCALICYVRTDGSGHCVNLIVDLGDSDYRKFEDAQTNVAEAILVADVSAATRILVLHTKKHPPPTTTWQGITSTYPWPHLPENMEELHKKRMARREALLKASQVPMCSYPKVEELKMKLLREGKMYRDQPDPMTLDDSGDDA